MPSTYGHPGPAADHVLQNEYISNGSGMQPN